MATKIIGLDNLVKYIPQHVLRYLFPTSSNEVFVPEVRGNPSYFDSLPISVLQERLMANNSHAAILEKYQRRILELTSKGGSLKLPKRHMVGLESYDINNSPKYASKFGFRSEYIARARPTDWIIAKRSIEFSRRTSSASTGARTRRAGATTALNAFVKTGVNSHAKQVNALLEYCSPVLDSSGTKVRAPYRLFENDEFLKTIKEINKLDESIGAIIDHSEILVKITINPLKNAQNKNPHPDVVPSQEIGSNLDLRSSDPLFESASDTFLDV